MNTLSPGAALDALPGPLPAGEKLLWAVRPPFTALLRHLFKARWFAGAALVLAIWPVLAAMDAGYPFLRALPAVILFLPLALPAAALLALFAKLVAGHSLYVVTDRRVILHVGYVFTRTVNLPLPEVRDLSVRPLHDGLGDIQLTLGPGAPIGYAALFPHVRLGRFSNPTPVLRCVPDAEACADQLADALMRLRPGVRTEAGPVPAGAGVRA